MGTSEELRVKAQRLFDWARKACAKENLTASQFAAIGDTYDVSQAWLLEHPADDSRLLDEPWLNSIGLSMGICDVRCTPTPNYVYGKYEETIGIIFYSNEWQVIISDGDTMLNLTVVKTRGDVRRLAAALGIELKEPK